VRRSNAIQQKQSSSKSESTTQQVFDFAHCIHDLGDLLWRFPQSQITSGKPVRNARDDDQPWAKSPTFSKLRSFNDSEC
jgi:hypothetical protein